MGSSIKNFDKVVFKQNTLKGSTGKKYLFSPNTENMYKSEFLHTQKLHSTYKTVDEPERLYWTDL